MANPQDEQKSQGQISNIELTDQGVYFLHFIEAVFRCTFRICIGYD